ncbi:chemotaxis protein CheX [Haliovirga abyssi]|uniref:Chemotaxis phosphatase CheX-like domain-containing protein n=1 Tax=Haliovirga abyssi TaxID=2996794 RepID=A0AAU9DF96_9FUSO|nr:chemotaxis protein CheX [Haliovirga abyssi]BDU50047.1 hypothetical protein HLVA_06160 [Haliovirga abyssi]
MNYEKIAVDTISDISEKIIGVKGEASYVCEEISPISVENTTIIIGIAGQIKGQLIFGFTEETVRAIASKMIGQKVEMIDELAMSAIAEFANVLSGNVTINLVESGSKRLGVSPPSIVTGKHMKISTKIKPIHKFKIEYSGIGDITLNIALKEKTNK